jgi:outer membrane receptor protein involved in Fe transport
VQDYRRYVTAAARAGALIATGLVAVPAAAQQVSSAEMQADSSDRLDDIIVTGRLRAESLTEAPISVSVVSGSLLEKRGIISMEQIGTLVPSVTVKSQPLANIIAMRGITASPKEAAFDPVVGLFIDGVSYGNGRWINQAFVDLESVQVLKGPQGVYFGGNTVAGAIDVKTRGPGKTFEASALAGYEFNAKEAYVQAIVSGPVSDTLGVRVVARASKMSGWMRNTFLGKRIPDSESYLGRVTVRWEPSADLSVDLKAAATAYSDAGPYEQIQILTCGGPNNTPTVMGNFGVSGVEDCKLNNKSQNGVFEPLKRHGFTHYKSYAASLNLNWTTQFGTLTAISGYNRYRMNWWDGGSTAGVDALNVGETPQNRVISQEIRFLTDLTGSWNFLLGAYVADSNLKHRTRARLFPAPVFTYQRRGSQDSTNVALFGEVNLDLTDQLSIDAGVRYSLERRDSHVGNYAFSIAAFNSPQFHNRFKDSNFAPQVTLSYKPSDDALFYAAYKTGFLPGGMAQSSILTAATKLDELTYDSETVKGGETGTRLQLLGNTVQFNATAYYYKYKNLQVTAYNPNTLNYSVGNAGSVTSKGVDFDLLWAVSHGLRIAGSLNYNKARFHDYIGTCYFGQTAAQGCSVPLRPGLFGQDLEGKPTPYAPAWVGSLSLDYTHEVGDYKLNLAGDLHYSDKYELTQKQRPELRQPSYATVGASVRFGPANDKWQVALIGRNLTNEKVVLAGDERPLAGADTTAFIDRLRQIELQFRVNF